MPIKYKRNESKVIARSKVLIDGLPNRYYSVFLWSDRAAMMAAFPNDIQEHDNTDAFCCHGLIVFGQPNNQGPVRIRTARRVGEIHFLTGKWDMEVVAHECFHATMHICEIMAVEPMRHIEMQEIAAYLHGEMVDKIYRWLWQVESKNNKKHPAWFAAMQKLKRRITH